MSIVQKFPFLKSITLDAAHSPILLEACGQGADSKKVILKDSCGSYDAHRPHQVVSKLLNQVKRFVGKELQFKKVVLSNGCADTVLLSESDLSEIIQHLVDSKSSDSLQILDFSVKSEARQFKLS